jgi:hypothetical protein
MHPIVLRDSDRRVRIACDYPSSKVTLTDELMVAGVPPRFMDPNQVNVTQTVSGIAALPKVRLQIRNGSGKEVQGAQLGDTLILSIDMVEEASAFGIAASDLVAMSGSGDETLQLLDGRGYVCMQGSQAGWAVNESCSFLQMSSRTQHFPYFNQNS